MRQCHVLICVQLIALLCCSALLTRTQVVVVNEKYCIDKGLTIKVKKKKNLFFLSNII